MCCPKIDPDNIRAQVEIVGKELSRGRGPKEISEKYGMDPALTEQIVRLYVTHPGVTVDGVMTKMEAIQFQEQDYTGKLVR